MSNKKKAIILLFSYFAILLAARGIQNKNKSEVTYNDSYEEYTDPFAYYGDKCIYIGDCDEIELIRDDNDGNIYIADRREEDNPTMSIYDSYRLRSVDDIRNILRILMRYECEYPSEWDRSLSSLEKEWLAHNICYYLGYETSRTEKVDLDNLDEENYRTILQIFFRIREIIEKEKESIRSLKR